MYIKILSGNAGDFRAYSAVACRKDEAEYEIVAPKDATFTLSEDGNVELIRQGVVYIQRMKRVPVKALAFVPYGTVDGYPLPPSEREEIFVHLYLVGGIPPAPQKIKDARVMAGLTQGGAADVVYSTRRTWEDWERGVARMHPAIFELFCIKIGRDCKTNENER